MTKINQIIINAIAAIFVFLSLEFGLPSLVFGQSAALLPMAQQQFFDNNGNPLSNGTVTTYSAGTSTLKTTWRDAAETIANTNPVILDAGGKAIIFGDGNYRQLVKDRNGNTIWDAVTSAVGTGSGATLIGDGTNVGTILPWSGLTAPTHYAFAYGQELSRITYSSLYTAITLNANFNCTSASAILSGLADTTQIPIGAVVEATCVAAGTTVLSKTASTVTVSNNASVTIGVTGRFFPYGNGNGTSTFNVPDLRGRSLAGRDNMGGTAASRLTSTYFANPGTGATGGGQAQFLITANLPPYTPAGSIASSQAAHSHFIANGDSGGIAGISGSNTLQSSATFSTDFSYTLAGTATAPSAGISSSATPSITSTLTGTAQGGTSAGFTIVQPTMTLNYIIKTTTDANISTLSVVTSIQTMVGDITCSGGVICSGNNISVSSAPISSIIINVTSSPYNAVCNGSTDDTVAIRAAAAAAASNKVHLYFPSICFVSDFIDISDVPRVFCQSQGSGFAGSGGGLISSHTTANVFTKNSTFPTLIENCTIRSSVTRSAGAGISLTGNAQGDIVRNNEITDQYRGIECDACLAAQLTGNSFTNFINHGIHIQNTVNPDTGDGIVAWNIFSVCVFNGTSCLIPDATVSIYQLNSGGWTIHDNKVIRTTYALYLDRDSTAGTGIYRIHHNSWDTQNNTAMVFQGTGSGTFEQIDLADNISSAQVNCLQVLGANANIIQLNYHGGFCNYSNVGANLQAGTQINVWAVAFHATVGGNPTAIVTAAAWPNSANIGTNYFDSTTSRVNKNGNANVNVFPYRLVGPADGSGVLTFGGNVTFSGAFTTTLTVTANTGVTLPTAGTLATLTGSETLTNKTLSSPILTGPSIGVATFTGLQNGTGSATGNNLVAINIGTATARFVSIQNSAGEAIYGVDVAGAAYAWLNSGTGGTVFGTNTASPVDFYVQNVKTLSILQGSGTLATTQVYVRSTLASTTKATGSLRVDGGAGIAGSVFANAIDSTNGYSSGGTAGLSVTKTIRAAGGVGDCTLIYVGGILTGGSC